MRSGKCNCLALYDWDGELSIATFHDIARSVFDANRVIPDTCSIVKPEEDRNRLYKYSRVISDLTTLQGSVSIYHTIPNYTQLVFGWDIFASLNIEPDKTMVFCYAQELSGLDLGYFESVVQSLSQCVSLRYGIGYQRSFDFGPELYAYGMGAGLDYGPVDRAVSHRIGMWMRERINARRHLQGYLRDVYPLNVLSSAHLAREVEGVPLSRWIEASTERGVLTALPNGAWLWKIPELQLPLVQTTLQQAGCTIVPPLA